MSHLVGKQKELHAEHVDQPLAPVGIQDLAELHQVRRHANCQIALRVLQLQTQTLGKIMKGHPLGRSREPDAQTGQQKQHDRQLHPAADELRAAYRRVGDFRQHLPGLKTFIGHEHIQPHIQRGTLGSRFGRSGRCARERRSRFVSWVRSREQFAGTARKIARGGRRRHAYWGRTAGCRGRGRSGFVGLFRAGELVEQLLGHNRILVFRTIVF